MTATHVLSDNKEHDQSEQESHVRSIYAVREGATMISEASRHVELNVPPVLKYSAGKVASCYIRANLMKFKGQALMRRAGDGIKGQIEIPEA